MIRLDLHCHSTASDGNLPPETVASRAFERGCQLLALTDHDTLAGIESAAQSAKNLGLPFVAGVEVSVTWRKKTVHIVGLDFDFKNQHLGNLLTQIRQGRIARAELMAEALSKRLPLATREIFDGAMRFCAQPEMISRTHFARFLIDAGFCKNMQRVFKHYLAEGKIGYVAHEWSRLGDAVAAIVAAGGVAIVAHPGRYKMGKMQMNELLTEFIDAGGRGIEVISGSHGEDDVRYFTKVARDKHLLASAGSDFHALGEGGRDLGVNAHFAEDLTPIWSVLSQVPLAMPSALAAS